MPSRLHRSARALNHRSLYSVRVFVRMCVRARTPFRSASSTSSQLHLIRDHGRVEPGHPGQVEVVEEDVGEEALGDRGEEEGAEQVDEGPVVEEGALEQIPTQECEC